MILAKSKLVISSDLTIFCSCIASRCTVFHSQTKRTSVIHKVFAVCQWIADKCHWLVYQFISFSNENNVHDSHTISSVNNIDGGKNSFANDFLTRIPHNKLHRTIQRTHTHGRSIINIGTKTIYRVDHFADQCEFSENDRIFDAIDKWQ